MHPSPMEAVGEIIASGEIIVSRRLHAVTCQEGDKILQYPSAYYAVIRQYDERYYGSQLAEPLELFVDDPVSGKCALLSLASDNDL